MNKKFLSIVMSLLLVVTMSFTGLFATACNNNPQDQSGSGQTDVPPEPPTPIPDDTPEDRSDYTVETLATAMSNLYIKDIVTDGTTINKCLDGYLLGDVFAYAVDGFIQLATSNMPAGIDLTAIDLQVYRGHDGKWYRTVSKTKVNACLNNILNYKLDGSEALNIDYTLYGEQTVAYILFDYAEPTQGTMDRNWMLSMLFNSHPLLTGISKTTLNQVKTLLSGTMSEKTEIVLANFGTMTLKDIVTVQGTQNKFVEATLKISLQQAYDILNAADQKAKLNMLAEVYKGVNLGDALGVDESMPNYIREIHSMSLYSILSKIADGTIATYLTETLGTLTLDKVIRANLATDANLLAEYDKVYAQFKTLFDTTLAEFINCVTDIELPTPSPADIANALFGKAYEKVKEVKVLGNITIDNLVVAISKNMTTDEQGKKSVDLVGVIQYMNTNHAEDLNTVTISGQITLGAVVAELTAAIDGQGAINFANFITAMETKYLDDLNGVANLVMTGMTYDELKAMVNGWMENGTFNPNLMIMDVANIIYKKINPTGNNITDITTQISTALATIFNKENYKEVLTALFEKVLNVPTFEELDQLFKTNCGKTLTEIFAEIEAKLQDTTADFVNAVLETFTPYIESIVKMIQSTQNPLVTKINEIVEKYTTTDEGGNKTINYVAIVDEVVTLIKTEHPELDTAIIDYTDIEGNKLTITGTQILELAANIAKVAFGETIDIKEQVANMFGNAKVSTLIEYVMSLAMPTLPDQGLALAA